MRQKVGPYIFLWAVLLTASKAFCETYGTSSVMFLNEEASPECFAKAGVCSFSVNSAGAAFSNPGLLGHMTESAFSLSYWNAPDGIGKYGMASFIYSAGQYGSFNLSYLGYNSGSETFYDLSGNQYNLNLQQDYAISGGWGIPFDERLFWGFKAKSVTSSLAEKYKANSMTFATGAVYKSLDDFFSASFLLDNFGGALNYRYEDEKLPTSAKAEAGIRYFSKYQTLALGISAKKILKEKFIEKGVGAEIEFNKMPFVLIGGYKNSYGGNFVTAGFAFKIAGLRIDYAAQFPDTFGNGTHRIGLSFNFSSHNDGDRAVIYAKRDLKRKAEVLSLRHIKMNEKNFVRDRKEDNLKAVKEAQKEEKKKNPKENEESKEIKTQVKPKETQPVKKEKKQEKKEVYWQDWLLLP
ncbi:MAG: hypothetical protein AB1637_01890 [Elusimicrobiota bacterium]